MPTSLTHIVDETTDEPGLRQLSLLLERMDGARVRQRVVVTGAPPAVLQVPPGIELVRVRSAGTGRRFGRPGSSAGWPG